MGVLRAVRTILRLCAVARRARGLESICDARSNGCGGFVVADGCCAGFVLWLSFSTMTREVKSRLNFQNAPRRRTPGSCHLRVRDRVICPTVIGDS